MRRRSPAAVRAAVTARDPVAVGVGGDRAVSAQHRRAGRERYGASIASMHGERRRAARGTAG